jgi:hypothetical protein
MKTAIGSTTLERRRYARDELATAVLVSPNGHDNRTTLFDLSDGGARVGLPLDFEHGAGESVRLFFPLTSAPIVVLNARIVRVAIDHLGVEFAEGQAEQIHHLMAELSEAG